MAQYDKKNSDDRFNKIISDHKKWRDGLESETCSPEPVSSSAPLKIPRQKLGLTRAERDHAWSPATKPEGRHTRKVRFTSIERPKSTGSSHSRQNEQTRSIDVEEAKGKSRAHWQ
ncbi:hypothetical protein N7466_001412 [Penicillium verhagenii]|uniref:uncharacterized protein n=1 Tax=Penicillium verhagenii TaxID=1562060 RepID=UPI0025456C4B|nr:uncharacterized protein N7466_001412 [Penicillium verhagenii]KAJ5938278.1 hypothetical protein N7466_001412 [Penicillium verhagenii]